MEDLRRNAEIYTPDTFLSIHHVNKFKADDCWVINRCKSSSVYVMEFYCDRAELTIEQKHVLRASKGLNTVMEILSEIAGTLGINSAKVLVRILISTQYTNF